MRTMLTVVATLALWQVGQWLWRKRPQTDLDQWIVRWRPTLITRREADVGTRAALTAEIAEQSQIADRRVAEALATLVDDPRTAEEMVEFKAVFERVHADDRWKDLPPTQQAAAARRIQQLGMERLGLVDPPTGRKPKGRGDVPPVQ